MASRFRFIANNVSDRVKRLIVQCRLFSTTPYLAALAR
jgi:hypothetical protein